MGGELEVRNESCERCNRDFGMAETAMKEATTPLLNLRVGWQPAPPETNSASAVKA